MQASTSWRALPSLTMKSPTKPVRRKWAPIPCMPPAPGSSSLHVRTWASIALSAKDAMRASIDGYPTTTFTFHPTPCRNPPTPIYEACGPTRRSGPRHMTSLGKRPIHSASPALQSAAASARSSDWRAHLAARLDLEEASAQSGPPRHLPPALLPYPVRRPRRPRPVALSFPTTATDVWTGVGGRVR